MRRLCVFLVVQAIIGASFAQTDEVKPLDHHIRYIGRVDLRDPAGPRVSWSASAVEIEFRGTDLKAKIKEAGSDQYQVVVDGSPTNVVVLQNGEASYHLAVGLTPGVHTIQFVKRTEAGLGITQFLGFSVTGKLMFPRAPRHTLEVIGDSISCGYGNEGKSKEEAFKVDTENAYMTYGSIAARDLKADLLDIAWSGRTMWPTFSIPEIYDFALPTDKSSIWNMRQDVPGAIVINLATNDFARGNPDEKQWTAAYAAFIARLRKRAPRAMIYCATGPMMSDTWPPKMKPLSTLRTYLQQVVALREGAGDRNVRLIEFETQNEGRDGIGAAWHPNLTTHNNMAAVLTARIRKDLGW